MSITRSKFQRFLFPGLDEVINRSFNEMEEVYSQWCNVKSSDSAFEEDMSMTGTGLFVRTPENVEAAEDEGVPGFNKRYNHEDYTLGIGISWQTQRDSKVSLMSDRAAELGFSARQTIEILVHDILNQGFTAANGPDGKPLFAVDHPHFRVGIQSNLLNPVGELTVTNYRLMLTQFRRQFDHTGVRRIQMVPATVIIPPELEHDLDEITMSSTRPDTANRADNVTKGRTGKVVSSYLLDANNWFMSVDKSRLKLKCFMRERFHTWEDEEKRARLNWIFSAFALSFGFSDYLGIIGSNPA